MVTNVDRCMAKSDCHLLHSSNGSSMTMRDQRCGILYGRFPRRQVSTRLFNEILLPTAWNIENARFARTTKIHQRTFQAHRKCLRVAPWFRKCRNGTFFTANGGQAGNIPCDVFRFLPLDIFHDETFPSGVRFDARSVRSDACRPLQNEAFHVHTNKEFHVMSKRTHR